MQEFVNHESQVYHELVQCFILNSFVFYRIRLVVELKTQKLISKFHCSRFHLWIIQSLIANLRKYIIVIVPWKVLIRRYTEKQKLNIFFIANVWINLGQTNLYIITNVFTFKYALYRYLNMAYKLVCFHFEHKTEKLSDASHSVF